MYNNILEFKGIWRTYQQRVLDKFDEYGKDRRIHVVAAPGSGKTTLGIELIKRTNQIALILVPTITIREQWIDRISKAFLCNETDRDKYLSQDLKHPKLITAATYQALFSAMSRYSGKLVEEDDEFKMAEEVDYCDFDVLETFKNHQLGTLCLDECHHLRNEWWKSLEEFKKAFNNIFTIALTATPPYDSNINMWSRYMDMCGDIDEEITVPELVKDGTLCPHQDYVYFNYPTSFEKQEINIFKENAKNILNQLFNDKQFLQAVQSHRFFTGAVSDEELLENPAYLSSLLIFLNDQRIDFSNRYQKLLGFKKLEPMSLRWLEILLQGFFYDDVESYEVDENYRQLMMKELKAKGLIEKRKVSLQVNQVIEKMLINSRGKCESIKQIVFHEYQNLGENLRLLILTDYIRKEYESSLGDETKVVNNLGVLPFFEQLRRESVNRNRTLKLGVLCGSIIIIPIEAKEALFKKVNDLNKIKVIKAGKLEDYIKIEINGNHHFLIGAVSELFAQGYIQVLIGTKSLLGEGWDCPCVNTLILASFVGSYMLSNQMRGRAIRVFKDDFNKTSNIWHLVCVRPRDKLQIDNNSEDFEMLARRMEHFLGLHYQQDTIENGVERLSAIRLPFSPNNIKKTNQAMLNLSNQRELLKDKWERSLAIYEKIEIVDETEVRDKYITVVLFNDALRLLIIMVIAGIIGVTLGLPLLKDLSLLSIQKYIFVIVYIAIFSLGILLSLKKVLVLKNPMARLNIFGKGIREALEKTSQLDCYNSRVEVESYGVRHAVYLLGGTGHDKALFAKCVNEFFAPIDNQRYILYNQKRKGKLDCYFAIPDCFAKRKEDAIIFAQYMKPFIGKYEVIYTRNESGRKILLNARIDALANREERCFTRKKVKGALE